MSSLGDIAEGVRNLAADGNRPQQLVSAMNREIADLATNLASLTSVRSVPGVGESMDALRTAQRAVADAAAQLASLRSGAESFAAQLVDGAGSGAAHGVAVVGSASTGPTSASTPGPSADAGAAADMLDAADTAALADYTGDGFQEINRSLRGDQPVTSDVNARAAGISAALAKLPDRPGPVFRGTSLTSEQTAAYVPGAVRREAGFTSTTSDSASAFPGNTLFLVISKHGKDVSSYSRYAESEVLFDKGTAFLVTSNFYDRQEGKQVIIMMEV